MQPDNELLRQYAAAGSETAFAELVSRHVNLVYSAALRQTAGDTHLAHDVAQSVFTDLARKSASLLNRESLSGWLYTSAYFTANKLVRTETRRRQREEQFMRDSTHETPPEADWEKLRPLLDVAMHSLKESDREAILLRYFENRPYAEVGAKFGLNENAARLRVERALEKLRALLAKRGLTAGTTLASILSANAIQTAPGSLTANLARLAATGAAIGKSAPISAVGKIKFAVSSLAVVAVITTFVLHHPIQKPSVTENQAAKRLAANIPNQDADPANATAEALPTLQNTTADDRQNQLLKPPVAATKSSSNASPEITTSTQSTNQAPDMPVEVIRMDAKFATVPTAQMTKLSSGWASGGNGSVLSAGQYEKIDDALVENGGVQLSTGLFLMTGSGYPTEAARSIANNSTNAHVVDVVLGANPSFNSSVFTLNVVAEFSPLHPDPLQPGIQLLQTSNQFHLFADQVAVLETDIPPGGWLAKTLLLSETKCKLLVFIKPITMPGKVIWKIPFQHANGKTNVGSSPFE